MNQFSKINQQNFCCKVEKLYLCKPIIIEGSCL